MLYFINHEANKTNFEFYSSKLECQRCGRCCRTPAGQILLPGESAKLAHDLGISHSQFKGKYTFTKDGSRFINAPCPFLTDSGCSIYQYRPTVCREYPFNRVYHHEKSGRNYMTVAPCPAGKLIADKYAVKV